MSQDSLKRKLDKSSQDKNQQDIEDQQHQSQRKKLFQEGESTKVFSSLQLAPPDPILGTTLAFKADTHPQKMNLGVGAYRDDDGKPYVFNVIRKVEQQLASDYKLDKEYLPIDGLQAFNTLSRNLLFGADSPLIKQERIVTSQAISGTGALRLGFEFLKRHLPKDILISDPTWGNHLTIIKDSGLQYKEYPYYDPQTRGLNFNGMTTALKQAQKGSIVLFHACAHNPTGVDPTFEQWKEIAVICKQNDLFPFFDSAYQGYASGDLSYDAQAIRYFVDQGFQLIATQSFAKNIGLYGERVGAIHFVCDTKSTAEVVLSQLKLVIRPMYSNPPLHGAQLVANVLGNEQNFQEWQEELKNVSNRIITMRKLLRQQLEQLSVPGSWDHITNQIGMFSYTGLTTSQCEILINKHHIYLLKNGRISMAGINSKNVEYLANSIKDSIISTLNK